VWTDIGPSLSNCINGALPSKAPFDTALAIYFARISDGDKKKIFNIFNDPNFFMSTACSGSGTAEVFPILLWRYREVGLKSADLLLLDFSFWMYCTVQYSTVLYVGGFAAQFIDEVAVCEGG
jgi:hypothetical protein